MTEWAWNHGVWTLLMVQLGCPQEVHITTRVSLFLPAEPFHTNAYASPTHTPNAFTTIVYTPILYVYLLHRMYLRVWRVPYRLLALTHRPDSPCALDAGRASRPQLGLPGVFKLPPALHVRD